MAVFLSTGQFIKEAGTTKRTLLYYDKLRLLTPEETSIKGIRKYNRNQVNNFNLIRLLQETGVPLQEIYIELKNTNYSYSKLFNKFSSKIEDSIKQKQAIFEKLSANYSNPNTLLSKFEVTLMPSIVIYKSRKSTDLKNALENINEVFKDFTTSNESPILCLEINDGNTVNIAVANDKNLFPLAHAKQNYIKETITQEKSLKRISTVSKSNENIYFNKLIKASQLLNKNNQHILIFIHSRNKIHKKYLCESYIQL